MPRFQPLQGACARPPAHQRRADFRYAFSVFEFALIRKFRIKGLCRRPPFDFSSFRAENFSSLGMDTKLILAAPRGTVRAGLAN
jgi:hypothetical protein